MDNEELNNVPDESKETNSNDIHNRYIQFLKQQVYDYCNGNGMYEVNYDYRDLDVITDDIGSIFDEYDGNTSVQDMLTDYLVEASINSGWFPEDDLLEAIRENVADDSELSEYLEDRVDNDLFWDDMSEVGYKGVDYRVDELLDNTKVDVNILLSTDNEANYDMGSIVSCFGTDYLTAELDWIDESYLDNAITYLLHQQGHTLRELYDELYGDTNSSSKLVKSVAQEIENNPAEAMSALTLLVKTTLGEYGNLLRASKGANVNFEVPVNTQLGIFNPWIGSGSVMEIELEKPFVFSGSLVHTLQIDNSSGSYGSYTVGNVYGGIDRDTGVSVTQSVPELVDEDITATLDYARQKYGKNNEVEESKSLTENVSMDKVQEIIDKCKQAYADDNIKLAYKYWSDMYDTIIPQNEEEYNALSDEEKNAQFEILHNATEQFTDQEVYDITDFGKGETGRHRKVTENKSVSDCESDLDMIMEIEGGNLQVNTMEELNRVLELAKDLSLSQGFYGRLYRDIKDVTETDLPIIL